MTGKGCSVRAARHELDDLFFEPGPNFHTNILPFALGLVVVRERGGQTKVFFLLDGGVKAGRATMAQTCIGFSPQ